MGVSLATKLWIHLSGNVDAVYAQGTENSALPLMIPQQQLPGGGRLMIGFAGSSLNVTDKAAVQAAVRTYIPGATIVTYRAQQWGADRWSRGGWGLRRPTQLLRQLRRCSSRTAGCCSPVPTSPQGGTGPSSRARWRRGCVPRSRRSH